LFNETIAISALEKKALIPVKIIIITICNNKCIYYGDISENDSYFLILLYRMMFDVIYINPIPDTDVFEKTDRDRLSTRVDSFERVSKKLLLKEL